MANTQDLIKPWSNVDWDKTLWLSNDDRKKYGYKRLSEILADADIEDLNNCKLFLGNYFSANFATNSSREQVLDVAQKFFKANQESDANSDFLSMLNATEGVTILQYVIFQEENNTHYTTRWISIDNNGNFTIKGSAGADELSTKEVDNTCKFASKE